ncbi:MAG: hypothetical protein ABL999_15130 [Pyrinomonadaceae bacterium]
MTTSSHKFPGGLSNLQLELLRLYGTNVSDRTLEEIKLILAKYFAERASDAMEQVWENRSIAPEDMMQWANGHDRIEDRP